VLGPDVDGERDGGRDPERGRTFWRPLALIAAAGFTIRLIEVTLTH
jgi:hypothetical protein